LINPIPQQYQIIEAQNFNLMPQIIQKNELEISSQTIPFAVMPSKIIISKPVSYTFSFDCYIESLAPSWRNILNNGLQDYGANSRLPAVFITGNDTRPANRIHIVHGSKEDINSNIISNFSAPIKEWFNITFIVNDNKLTTYFDGIEDKSVKGTFNWGTISPTNWKWNQYGTKNSFGNVKVKNAVFWNIPLVKSQIDIITNE
jgi:hypothetical protein